MRLYHNYLFFGGFVYYLILPLIMGYNDLLLETSSMNIFFEKFIDERSLKLYIILCAILFISFYLGSISALAFTKKTKNKNEKLYFVNAKKKCDINLFFLYSLCFINQILILSHRSILFTGYSSEYQVGFLGQVATFNCLYLFLYLYSVEIHGRNTKLLLSLLLENSIVLIGSGSRMFVLIPVVSFIVYLFDKGKIKFGKLFVVSICGIAFFLIVGVLRSNGSIDLSSLLYIGMGEPLFTWISAATFLSNNAEIHLIDYPANFMGTFINLIPSVIFPNKGNYIASINYDFDTPLGACSIITSLYGNFGLLITPWVVYIGGFLLTVLRYSKSVFAQILYYCCCGVIPFLMFRDIQSVNKLVFMGFMFYPAVFIYFRLNKRH